jgi:flagellar biosynthesis protein FlhB
MADAKTEEPTLKRIQDARRKGQVWRSRDLTAVLAYLVAMGVLKATWASFEEGATRLFEFAFEKMVQPSELAEAIPVALFLGLRAVVVMSLPVLAAAAVTGAVVEFLTVGALFTADPLIPKLERLNPLPGIKNMFSKRQAVELVKSMAKIAIAGVVACVAIADALPDVVLSMRAGASGLKAVLGQLIFGISLRVGVLFLFFALVDVWFQRRAYMKELMMSKEEVRRELKESEGDPHHKARRKELAIEILEGAQLDAVKLADVIIVNPDHVAVALRYRVEREIAPRVVYRGVDARAQAIKALARQHGIPLLHNVPLAHALLEVELDAEIPEELYDAVAEVLNVVHRLSLSAKEVEPETRRRANPL